MIGFDQSDVGFDQIDVGFDGTGGPGPGPVAVPVRPTLALWWSPGTGPYETPTWVPFPPILIRGQFRDRMRAADGIAITRGRSDELSSFDAGTMSLVIDNRDRALDPLNTVSPHRAGLRPNVPIQLRATWDGVTYPLFTGFAAGWPQSQDISRNDLTVLLDCTDMFKPLSVRDWRPARPWVLGESDGNAWRLDGTNRLGGVPSFGEQMSGQRVATIVDHLGIDAALVDVDGGDTQVLAHATESELPIDYLDQLARTELGRLFISKDGRLTFRERSAGRNVGVELEFADDRTAAGRFADLTVDPADETLCRNEIERGIDGADRTAVRRKRTSIRLYGQLAWSETDLLYASRDEPADAAGWLLARYAEPVPRVKQMVVRPLRNPAGMWPFVLDAEVGDRIVTRFRPGNVLASTTRTVTVEQVDHRIDGSSWETTFTAGSADLRRYWTLDGGSFSVLDGTNVLGY